MPHSNPLLVVGYIRNYTVPQHHLSIDVYDNLTALCYEYINGNTCDTKTIHTQKKIRLHCSQKDQNKQFSCFVGPQINDLYDDLLFSAKIKFSFKTNSLYLFRRAVDGHKSFVNNALDLKQTLHDTDDKQTYLNLYLGTTHAPKVSHPSSPPYIIHQSITDPITPLETSYDHVEEALFIDDVQSDSFPFCTVSECSSQASSEYHAGPQPPHILTDIETDDMILQLYGYSILDIVKDTFNGCIYEAHHMQTTNKLQHKWDYLCAPRKQKQSKQSTQNVAIKKVRKNQVSLYSNDISCIEKEALILHHLTVRNRPPQNNICKFIEFIETDTAYFLVEEYGTRMTLAMFVQKAHKYIKEKRLQPKEWKVFIKYLFWQLVVHMFWMNYNFKCCHLGLNMNNILITNANFVLKNGNGSVCIDAKSLCIKLCDFAECEVFPHEISPKDLKCVKNGLNMDCIHKSPEHFNGETFNPIQADSWSLGVILFTLFAGVPPYHYPDASDEGYCALQRGELMDYSSANVPKEAVKVIQGLLCLNAKKRMTTKQLLHCKWFRSYYKRSETMIHKKTRTQKLKLDQQQTHIYMKQFPFYHHSDH